jgi:hypothetical protein
LNLDSQNRVVQLHEGETASPGELWHAVIGAVEQMVDELEIGSIMSNLRPVEAREGLRSGLCTWYMHDEKKMKMVNISELKP